MEEKNVNTIIDMAERKKILNPKTGRMVYADLPIGKKIIAEQKKGQIPKKEKKKRKVIIPPPAPPGTTTLTIKGCALPGAKKCPANSPYCNVETGRCLKKSKPNYGELKINNKIYVGSQNTLKKLEYILKKGVKPVPVPRPSPPKVKPPLIGAVKGCAKKKEPCEKGKMCNLNTGRCMNDNAKNRTGRQILETKDGKIYVGDEKAMQQLKKHLGIKEIRGKEIVIPTRKLPKIPTTFPPKPPLKPLPKLPPKKLIIPTRKLPPIPPTTFPPKAVVSPVYEEKELDISTIVSPDLSISSFVSKPEIDIPPIISPVVSPPISEPVEIIEEEEKITIPLSPEGVKKFEKIVSKDPSVLDKSVIEISTTKIEEATPPAKVQEIIGYLAHPGEEKTIHEDLENLVREYTTKPPEEKEEMIEKEEKEEVQLPSLQTLTEQELNALRDEVKNCLRMI